jgi:hypothetical protein
MTHYFVFPQDVNFLDEKSNTFKKIISARHDGQIQYFLAASPF